MSSKRIQTAFIGAIAAVAMVLAACGTSSDTEAVATGEANDKPVIVATTSILGDVTANVVGDLATVEVIMPINADPHDFEPSARDAAMLRDADLIVANGLLLEEGLISTIESAESDGTPVIEVAEFADPIEFEGKDGHSHSHDDDDHGHSHSHSHDGDDPHFWQDPARMAMATAAIADAVIANTDLDAEVVEAQADAYIAELMDLDAELEATFAAIPAERRVLVTNHDAFGYLSDRYGFDVVGTIFPTGSELAEPSAASLVDLIALIDELGVPAIFTENIATTDLADTLASEASTDVVVVSLFSDSLGGPNSGGGTYLEMMRTNADRISGALG